MTTEVLEKIKSLPVQQQQQLADFADFLVDKYLPKGQVDEDLAAIRRSNLGKGRGQIWIAGDFDETPEDFKDYL